MLDPNNGAKARQRVPFSVRRLLERRRTSRELDELLTGRRKYPDPALMFRSERDRALVTDRGEGE